MQVIAPLLRILEKMHTLKLLHRDIKPENIFLTALGKFRLVRMSAGFTWWGSLGAREPLMGGGGGAAALRQMAVGHEIWGPRA